MRKSVLALMALFTGALLLSACGSGPAKSIPPSTTWTVVTTTTTTPYPPGESFLVRVPKNTFIALSSVVAYINIDSTAYASISETIQYVDEATFGLGKAFADATSYSNWAVNWNGTTVAADNAEYVTLRIVLTGSQVYQWEKALIRSGAPSTVKTPQEDYEYTISHSLLHNACETLASDGGYGGTWDATYCPGSYPGTEPTPVTVTTLPWSHWLTQTYTALQMLSSQISVCDLGSDAGLTSILTQLANKAPDQNGQNVLYGDMLNLSQDATSLADRDSCSDVSASFNADLKQLIGDLESEGQIYP